MDMELTWDNEKNQSNLEKHGLDFHDANLVFKEKTISFEDNREDYGEIRYITLGELMGRCVVIIHTPRKNTRRIISMRKANAREKKIYQERLKAS